MGILIHVVAAALYAAAAWAYAPSARRPPAPPAPAARWLVPTALGAHAAALVATFVSAGGLDLSIQNAASLVAALCVAVLGGSGFLRALPASGAVVLPVAALCALLPALVSNPHRFAYADQPWAAAHIAVALLAYAFLLVAALTALLMTGLEKRLHRGLAAEPGGTPPLLTLERYLFRLIAIGFGLLTLALASGALFSEEVFGKPFTFSHKSLFSILAWLTFGALLAGRWRFGWRGRRALTWILAGTACLVLAYLGSKFVAEVLLGR
jgi:ABC-type uncharacterized transport system permease subunit